VVAAARPTFPRLFFENPAPGKEPLFVLVGASAVEVAARAVGIARGFAVASSTGIGVAERPVGQ
jgi:hypothetical protein